MELVRHLLENQESVVLRGDNVKDDNGYRSVLTDQGASASQLAAAKFQDTNSRLLGVTEEATDAASAHTQVRLSEAP